MSIIIRQDVFQPPVGPKNSSAVLINDRLILQQDSHDLNFFKSGP